VRLGGPQGRLGPTTPLAFWVCWGPWIEGAWAWGPARSADGLSRRLADGGTQGSGFNPETCKPLGRADGLYGWLVERRQGGLADGGGILELG
jgi:hypothetical protein